MTSSIQKILLATVMLFSFQSDAASTSCLVKKEKETDMSIHSIKWNTTSKQASLIDEAGETHKGTVTGVRKHEPGIKTNIYIRYNKNDYGIDGAEFIVFPTSENESRIIGVEYVIEKGQRRLHASLGNHVVECQTTR